jgi:hypothetical protein
MYVTLCGVILDRIKLLHVHGVYYFASALFFFTATLPSACSHTTYIFHSVTAIPYTVDSNSNIQNLLLVTNSKQSHYRP